MTQAFNLSQLANKVDTSGNLNAATGLANATPIANGGTNNASLAVTAGGALYTDGTKVVNVGAGSSGTVLTSQGASPPIWQTVAGGFSNMQVFTANGTFTVPAGITKVKVTVVGGGGANGAYNSYDDVVGTAGGGGGAAIEIISGLTSGATVSVTVGGGGNGGAGGTSSFGAFCSATGGARGFDGFGFNGYAQGGIGSGGNLNIQGGGATGFDGGSSILGGGGSSLNNGGAYGGGASGSSGQPINRTGAAGVVVVEW